jgi:hypothetical protein
MSIHNTQASSWESPLLYKSVDTSFLSLWRFVFFPQQVSDIGFRPSLISQSVIIPTISDVHNGAEVFLSNITVSHACGSHYKYLHTYVYRGGNCFVGIRANHNGLACLIRLIVRGFYWLQTPSIGGVTRSVHVCVTNFLVLYVCVCLRHREL